MCKVWPFSSLLQGITFLSSCARWPFSSLVQDMTFLPSCAMCMTFLSSCARYDLSLLMCKEWAFLFSCARYNLSLLMCKVWSYSPHVQSMQGTVCNLLLQMPGFILPVNKTYTKLRILPLQHIHKSLKTHCFLLNFFLIFLALLLLLSGSTSWAHPS